MRTTSVLYFSRGRGRGHAITDLALISEVLSFESKLDIQIVSYSTGAATIRERDYPVVDLNLPENNKFVETLVRAIQAIGEKRPQLVISHEEFCVPPAARALEIPCLFLIDWFPNDRLSLDCMSCAESIIFMDDPGSYDEPEGLRGRIEYVGPFIREMKVSRQDKDRCRAELGLPGNRPIILILPGGASASTEERAPLFDLVTEAIHIMDKNALAVWVQSREEQKSIESRIGDHPGILFMAPHRDIEKTMVAADLVITKETRRTGFELYALGIPSVSISYGLNPIDDYRVAHIKSNCALRAQGLTARSLSEYLDEMMLTPLPVPSISKSSHRGRKGTVAGIRRLVERYRA